MQTPQDPAQPQNKACRQKLVEGSPRPALFLMLGVFLGTGLALLSYWVGFLITGHQINDPIYFTLAPSSLLRGGLLYFPWKGLSVTILFSLSVGLLSALACRLIARWTNTIVNPQDLVLLSQTSYVLAVLPVLIQERGGIQVFLSYTLAVWIGALVARFGTSISRGLCQ